ncbi:MerR family DNA-binding transcriptional regulator [Streptomyces sp. NPDC019531]|uniref:MerR family DNA-binding transcriptional regulator n=1 Tax=Streptomyces sp. NPDC019531 TaxID=3365062 RepID=UPI00384DBC96
MTIGELSQRTGVPVRTLRKYTDLGLIHTLGRSPANYRLFDTDALWCGRELTRRECLFTFPSRARVRPMPRDGARTRSPRPSRSVPRVPRIRR